MGCCISKCKPKKLESLEELNSHVQDKLVISAQPPKTHIPLSNKVTPIPQFSNKLSPFPPSPLNCSTSSTSSFTCCTSSNNSTISSCSSVSGASSVLTLKDRSFSNEFLRACYKENPHIVRINSIKELASLSPGTALLKQSIPQRVINGYTPQKRVRSSTSPSSSLRQQKSFRKEPERLNSVYNYSLTSGRNLRSPSPSRRFSSGDHHNGGGVLAYNASKDQICSKRMVLDSKVKSVNSVSSSLRQESFRPASPNKNSSTAMRPCLKNRETSIHRISKIDESAVGEALSSQDNELIPMEDIGNPLISLDCFIFL